MSVKRSDYETLLAEYSNTEGAIALLKQYRPYMEMIPSLRRPKESIVSIPLPVIRIRSCRAKETGSTKTPAHETLLLPCDLAFVTCDPEWKIKMGVEIIVFIHRPDEDFSDLLGRWRQTQVYLDGDYEWLGSFQEQHMFSEGGEKIYPLFVLFEKTPERIKRGFIGACLPFTIEGTRELFPSKEQNQSAIGNL